MRHVIPVCGTTCRLGRLCSVHRNVHCCPLTGPNAAEFIRTITTTKPESFQCARVSVVRCPLPLDRHLDSLLFTYQLDNIFFFCRVETYNWAVRVCVCVILLAGDNTTTASLHECGCDATMLMAWTAKRLRCATFLGHSTGRCQCASVCVWMLYRYGSLFGPTQSRQSASFPFRTSCARPHTHTNTDTCAPIQRQTDSVGTS